MRQLPPMLYCRSFRCASRSIILVFIPSALQAKLKDSSILNRMRRAATYSLPQVYSMLVLPMDSHRGDVDSERRRARGRSHGGEAQPVVKLLHYSLHL